MIKKLLIISLVLLLTVCGLKYPELESDAISFIPSSFIDENDDDAAYRTIEYKDRIYMPYGTIKKTVRSSDIDKCIGYIEEDKDTRIYTLKADENNNFLMEYYIGTTLMNQPVFYRAVDTNGVDIDVPKYILSLDYNYWR